MTLRPVSPVPPQFLLERHWQILPAQMTDLPFIINSWCADEHTYVGRPSQEDVEVAKVGMRARVTRLLGSCKCAVVRPSRFFFDLHQIPVDKKMLFGFVCYGRELKSLRPIIHFVYVKPAEPATGTGLRKHGLADAMLKYAGVKPDEGAWCTHERVRVRSAMKSRGLIYNKYLLEWDPALLNAKLPGTPREVDPYQEFVYKWR